MVPYRPPIKQETDLASRAASVPGRFRQVAVRGLTPPGLPEIFLVPTTMEQFANEVMSGRKRGLAASLLRAGLWTAQWPYRLAVTCKNAAFDFGLREPFEAGVPVISVGNLTTGGTGKTPVVAFLTNWFRDAGVKVGLLSRGYKSLDSSSNDEKLVLDQLCPGVPHWQNRDRIEAAKRAVAEGCQLLILDDGFQHRRLQRDFDIVLVDATNPWGYGHCLPRGLMREPLRSIARADLVIITRADLVAPEQLISIRTELAKHNQVAMVVEATFQPTRLINAAGETRPVSEIVGKRWLGFCGIGNPASFAETLQQAGATLAAFESFPDHHHYTSADLTRLERLATESGSDGLLTTQKDLVKVQTSKLGGLPLWGLVIGTTIVRGTHIIEHHLFRLLDRVRGQTHD